MRCVVGLNFLKINNIILQNVYKVNIINITNARASGSSSSSSTNINSSSTAGPVVTVQATPLAVKTQKVSRAMKAYLERAKEHDDFMKSQHFEYQIGKRHLANIMGEDPETFTQKDIDNAIAYLFPSGIFDPRARPSMKSPDDVFPARKAAEFDETGRPFHSMFYTGRPNFFKLLYDIVEEMNKLNDLEERMVRRKNKPDPNQKIDLSGYCWLEKDELESSLVEKIADIEYSNFTNAMERLVSLPYSYKSRSFIDKFLRPLMDQTQQLEIPKPQIDAEGRQYITTYECYRKSATADVTIKLPGTGKININGKDITYFDDIQCREQILYPLQFSELLGKVDIEANVTGGGSSGQAGAIRWGISMCLRSFVDKEMVESMRIAGLLTRDFRRRERKKFGQEGARRKYTWKKR